MNKTLRITEMMERFAKEMDNDELLNCMRCGFCLPSCPTYIESDYKETHSPRGRIALMKAVSDGMIEPDQDVQRSLDLCLGCRACEPVCPSGVKYGHLLEDARYIINQTKKKSFKEKTVRKFVFNELFPHQERISQATGLLHIYQKSGLQKLARKTQLINLLPEQLRTMEKVLPEVPTRKEIMKRPRHLHAVGYAKKRVAFFSGCLMDTMFLKTNQATTELLQLAGCEVIIPSTQLCCGALHGHSGEKDGAKQLAKRNIEAFEKENVDYIITNAGGCGGFLIDYAHLLQDEEEWKKRAQSFVHKLKDISSLLVELDFHKKELALPPQMITYQDSCHLRNVMNTHEEPRKLLRSLTNVSYIEMENAESCCGSAGIYNILESEMSMQILDRKMSSVQKTHCQTVVTTNPGCLLQMKLGIEREGLSDKIRAVHLVDLLKEALEYKKHAL
ncbi:(Fe-S)-binding protein [Priestia filamentosa]|uniref:(Fe-S)-binding protein n=1 Tax=Priestia filamentosa TaxID=1402861 RepID=UPI00398281EB